MNLLPFFFLCVNQPAQSGHIRRDILQIAISVSTVSPTSIHYYYSFDQRVSPQACLVRRKSSSVQHRLVSRVIKQPAGSQRCHSIEECCLSNSERLIIEQSLDWNLLTTRHVELFRLLKPKGSFLPPARVHELWRSVPDLQSLSEESVTPAESLLAVTESCDIRVRSTPHTGAVLKS